MTDGPPVTVVDPHGAPPASPVTRPPWPRTERLLAVALGALLAVGVAAASNLRSRPPAPYARAVASEVTVGDPAGLLLDVVLVGDVPAAGRPIADEGWSVVMSPEELRAGTALVLAHDSTCTGLRPPRVLHLAGVDLPVRDGARVLSCDPAEPLRVLRSSLTSSPRTVAELTVVNASSRDLRLTALRYDGFALEPAERLPVVLGGRDPGRPLRPSALVPHVLRFTARVTDCARARASLARAVGSRRPDALPVTVDGRSVDLTVRGLEVYLDLRRRATCVR